MWLLFAKTILEHIGFDNIRANPAKKEKVQVGRLPLVFICLLIGNVSLSVTLSVLYLTDKVNSTIVVYGIGMGQKSQLMTSVQCFMLFHMV